MGIRINSVLHEFFDGRDGTFNDFTRGDTFRYIWREPMLRSNLLLMVVVGTLAINFPVIMPLLARVTFHGNADTYGAMTVVMGVGALVGSLIVARRGPALYGPV